MRRCLPNRFSPDLSGGTQIRRQRAVMVALTSMLVVLLLPMLAADRTRSLHAQTGRTTSAPPTSQEDRPVLAAYYYKIKWGFQEEFLDLYRKNHYPVLAEQMKSGRLLRVEAFTPKFHGDGRADWNFVTIIVFKNWQAFGNTTEEAEVIKRLYSDQEKFKKEEQRRFELVEAHWDVPLISEPMR